MSRALLPVLLALVGCGSSPSRPAEAPLPVATTETSSAVLEDLEDTDARATQAFDRLLPFAAVKEERRGMVVVLPASILFEGGGAELMEAARARLDRVADVLSELPDRPVVVRGHEAKSADVGRDRELSRQRAEAVRRYLVGRGVSEGRVRVDGRGPDEPVASNATSAGRAENRRVEIVVEGAGAAAAQP